MRSARTWSLRTRLLAGLVGLMALVSTVIGVVSVVALDSVLSRQLDDQLRGTVQRAGGALRGDYGTPNPRASAPNDLPVGAGDPPRPGRGVPGILSLFATVRDGVVVDATVIDAARSAQTLSAQESADLTTVRAGAEPQTVSLGSLGDYRVIATQGRDGVIVLAGLPLTGLGDTVAKVAAVITVVTLVGLALACVLGSVMVRRALTPLRRVASTATRVSELPLDRGQVALAERVPDDDTDPRTEVGQMGLALNRLLGHVSAALQARQESEMRVRQFVADASHELRTPLASIRGYAELTRRSRDDAPPDVSHALDRIESAATRMTSLVEDLLLLARLDAGRPVASEPVDLTRLAVDCVSDAHATSPGHHWQVDLPDEPVEVIGDDERLHQAVANVLANARTHTPAGTTVALSLRESGDDVLLRVVDDGPGIPADLLPTVFERFARGDGSRAREAGANGGTGSTGLGLAIVSAVLEAHQGAVTIDSSPAGTVVTLRLPRVGVRVTGA